ncbi:hypothetical protein [Dermabacter sp. HSID17554]|uniref:hypothetical protein n=1 Tax=Dermabacter sp. HSID17554 TaxID=2419511 RepID=UPI000F89ABA3|nr:hypothetical protein [Dermabacter sp. HSID17554]RUP86710.1 hypothetical protein D8M36_04870 [Dermabacter sp. HSID17554]
MRTAHGADFKHASLLRITQKEFDTLEHQFLQERGSEDARTVQEEALDLPTTEEAHETTIETSSQATKLEQQSNTPVRTSALGYHHIYSTRSSVK